MLDNYINLDKKQFDPHPNGINGGNLQLYYNSSMCNPDAWISSYLLCDICFVLRIQFKSYEAGNKVSLEEKNNISDSKKELLNEKANLEILNKSISENKNYTEQGSVYSAQYDSYISSREMILNKKTQNKKEQLHNH